MRGPRFACKFCVALIGLKETEFDQLPATRAEAVAHQLREHGYPGRSAEEILASVRDPKLRRVAVDLIENSDPVARVFSTRDLQ